MKLDSSPGSIGPGFRVQLDFVHVAPAPVLTGLEAPYHRVIRAVEMLGRVLVRGGVTASHVAAGETEAQVHPPIAALQALFAALRSAGRDILDQVEVAAGSLHVR